MELFTQLFGDLLAFVYHCFDALSFTATSSGSRGRAGRALFSVRWVGVPVVRQGES